MLRGPVRQTFAPSSRISVEASELFGPVCWKTPPITMVESELPNPSVAILAQRWAFLPCKSGGPSTQLHLLMSRTKVLA